MIVNKLTVRANPILIVHWIFHINYPFKKSYRGDDVPHYSSLCPQFSHKASCLHDSVAYGMPLYIVAS